MGGGHVQALYMPGGHVQCLYISSLALGTWYVPRARYTNPMTLALHVHRKYEKLNIASYFEDLYLAWYLRQLIRLLRLVDVA